MAKFARAVFQTKYEVESVDWFAGKSEEEVLDQAKKQWPSAISFRATPPFQDGMAWRVVASFAQTGERDVFCWDGESEEAARKRLQKKYEVGKEKEDSWIRSAKLVRMEKVDGVVLDLIHQDYSFFGWANGGFSKEKEKIVQKAREEKEIWEIRTSASGNSYEVVSDKYRFWYCVDCS